MPAASVASFAGEISSAPALLWEGTASCHQFVTQTSCAIYKPFYSGALCDGVLCLLYLGVTFANSWRELSLLAYRSTRHHGGKKVV